MGKIQYAPTNMFWRGAMPNFTAAKARTGNPPRVAVYGDSNASGQGGGSGANGTIDARKNSWPVKMANALGWQDGSFFGDQNLKALNETVSAFDPRISLGSFSAGSLSIPGGCFITCVGASVSDLVFSPTNISDTIKVWYPTTSTATSSFEIYVDGVLKATKSQQGANSVACETISVTAGVHSVSIKNVGTGTCFLIGVETYNSQNAAPVLLLTSYLGANLSSLATLSPTLPWTHLSGIINLDVDVVITHCTINDIITGTALQDMVNYITGINDEIQKTGVDIINTVSFPFSNAGVYDGTLDKLKNVLLDNALSLGGSFADFRSVMGGTYTFTQRRLTSFNTAHPNALGYQIMADFAKRLFE